MSKVGKKAGQEDTIIFNEAASEDYENSADTEFLESALMHEVSYDDFEKKYEDELGVGSFIGNLRALIYEKNFDISQMPIKSGISRSYFYQVANGRRQASRDKIILIGISLRASFEEINTLLKSAEKQTLYAKSKRDSVIIYAIHHKYNIESTNKLLMEHGHQILS